MFNSYALDADLEEIPLTFGSSTYTYTSPWTPPPPATIRIDPSKTIDPLLTPCSNFTVNVTISDASEVYSFEFKLSFDKSILNVVQVQLGDFFPSSTIPIIIIDNTVGYMSISATLSSPPAVSGNGTLAKIMFHVEDFGPSSLTLYDVEIKDEMQRTLPCNVFDGYFNNVLLAKLYVDPAEIIDPTLVPPKTFEVNVTLDDVENLYGYEFNMSFNKDVLTCLYIIVHDVLGETNYEPEIQVSNINGFVWLKVTFYSPATPITTYAPVVLATIRFRVKSIGSSVLDLHDTMLADPAHDPVPHEVTDGFVMTVIRDVAIIAVTPSLPWAYAGWPVNITVVAKNLGNISETFDILTYYNNTVIDTIPVIDLPPNAEITVKFVWNTTGLTSGTYIISGSATIVPYEFNTTNNFYTNGEVAILTVKRNIAIVDVYTPSNWAYQGWIINITVIVKNLGELNETFDVSTYYNDNLIGVLHVENLTPDEEITLTFNWNTTSTTPCNNYTIISEATPVPYEYNLADNFYIDGTVKIRIIGDLNDDGKIDIKDLAMGSVAFGSYPGHPRWNPAADINRDKKVDIKDIATISANYGNAC
ncbi:hypothetical protein DRO69_11280 [Candidatus Bathyarchaeota archaeon]|nr:MAG: hypothetical protein DRO69_11280 [Candidatus Bathyarchaeota archaeon]